MISEIEPFRPTLAITRLGLVWPARTLRFRGVGRQAARRDDADVAGRVRVGDRDVENDGTDLAPGRQAGASEHQHVELCVPWPDADRSDLAGVPPGQSCRTGHRLAGPTGDGERQQRAGSNLPAPWACPSMVTCPGRVSATRVGGSER